VNAKSIQHIDFEKFQPNELEGFKWNKSLSYILLNDSLAKAAYQRINKNGVKIKLEGNKLDDYTFGLTEIVERGTKLQIRIFLPITKSPTVTARVIIHESRHVKIRILGKHNSIIDSIEEYKDLPIK
jgi:hypothetical protein